MPLSSTAAVAAGILANKTYPLSSPSSSYTTLTAPLRWSFECDAAPPCSARRFPVPRRSRVNHISVDVDDDLSPFQAADPPRRWSMDNHLYIVVLTRGGLTRGALSIHNYHRRNRSRLEKPLPRPIFEIVR